VRPEDCILCRGTEVVYDQYHLETPCPVCSSPEELKEKEKKS
jgi:hypothetical protein